MNTVIDSAIPRIWAIGLFVLIVRIRFVGLRSTQGCLPIRLPRGPS